MFERIRKNNFYRKYILASKKLPIVIAMYQVLLVSIIVSYPLVIEKFNPMVELSDMDKRQGIVVDVTGRKRCGQNLFLDVNGKILKYEVCLYDKEKNNLIGRNVTVWSQDKVGLFFLNKYKKIYQMSLGDNFIENYSEFVKNKSVSERFSNSILATCLFLICFSIFVIRFKLRDV